MRATAGLFRDAAADTTVMDGTTEKVIPKGHRLLVNMVKASMDPTVFPDPTEVKLDRDIKSYIHYGWGPHQCAGLDASRVALTTMFKAIVKLDGLRRAPGLQGELKRVPALHGYTVYMMPDWSSYYPIPMTMKIQWDGPAP
jgi:cytochrome P450